MPALEWSDLFAALALYLVLEGLLAFANPAALKRVLAHIITLEDSQLRRAGFGSIALGLLLLFWVRS
jgi:hypothetical protein